jgi:hypothetical protein
LKNRNVPPSETGKIDGAVKKRQCFSNKWRMNPLSSVVGMNSGFDAVQVRIDRLKPK